MSTLSDSSVQDSEGKLVYLVDDDEDDCFIFQQALKEGFPQCKLKVFANGLVMLEIMANPVDHPNLIFLDLHMPYPDGLELLMNLKINNQWSHIPVIILTGSTDPNKVRLAYQMGAQTVIQKPSHYEQLLEIVKAIRHYWFKLAHLPTAMG